MKEKRGEHRAKGRETDINQENRRAKRETLRHRERERIRRRKEQDSVDIVKRISKAKKETLFPRRGATGN